MPKEREQSASEKVCQMFYPKSLKKNCLDGCPLHNKCAEYMPGKMTHERLDRHKAELNAIAEKWLLNNGKK